MRRDNGEGARATRPRRAKTSPETTAKVAQMEADLEAARATIRATLVMVQAGGDHTSLDGMTLRDAAAQLQRLMGQRMEELEQKTQALQAANLELRNLTQNLDQIVRQRTRALAESESQLRRKNLELDRLNRMKAEFISIAAHELRTPMTSVVGYCDLFTERTDELPVWMQRQLASQRRSAYRLKRLIEDMLDASRLETGSITLRRAPCVLGEIVQGVVDELRPLAARKKLHAEVGDVPPIDADADKMHQVVSNLVVNSLKYTGDGGEIRLTVDTVRSGPDGEPSARLRVWDNGLGIPAALLDRIFEPFSDVTAAKHHTSRGPDSAGLGLYIARGIVELHGGSIRVESREGAFTEFTLLLPLA